jgi:hypothetical protein
VIGVKVIAFSGSPRQGAELIGGIDVLAWDKDDLVHDRPQQLRLARFASEICGKMKVLS